MTSGAQRPTLGAAALLAARFLVGGIFLLAGIAKVGDTTAFAETIRAFHLLPAPLVVPFALALPWFETLAGLYLLAGFFTRAAAGLVVAMLLVFITALGDALLTGHTAHSCGCFGGLSSSPVVGLLAGGSSIGWWDVIRDAILVALTALVLRYGAGSWSMDALLARRNRQDEVALEQEREWRRA